MYWTINDLPRNIASRRLHVEDLLDEALAASFPLSDPIAINSPICPKVMAAGLNGNGRAQSNV